MVLLMAGVVVWTAGAAIERPAAVPFAPGAPAASSTPAASSQMVEGAITEISGTSTAPVGLAIDGPDGVKLWLAVDPNNTVVLQGGRVTDFAQLESGQRVKARYGAKEGREVAQSIEITDPLPMPAPTGNRAAAGKSLSEF